MKCFLKRFGTLEVNKYVPYREHPNPEMIFVFVYGDWHAVPREDVELVE